MIRAATLLALALAAPAAAAQEPAPTAAPARTTTLEVRVVEAPPAGMSEGAPAERPVAGAAVEVLPAPGSAEPGAAAAVRSGKTGEDGVARIAEVPEGRLVVVRVRAAGFAPAEISNLLAGAGTARVALSPVARVVGRVVRAPGGAPVEGATVRGGGVEATTAADGSFALEGLAPGAVAIEASHGSGVPLDRPVAAAVAGKTVPVPDLRLLAFGSVRVRIDDPVGKPLAGIPVRLLPAAPLPAPAPAVLTGSDGFALLDPVPPAAGHRLVVEPRERWAPRVTDAFVVLPAEAADLGSIRLDAGGVLSGSVAGSDGLPVPGATVVLFDGGVDPLRVAADAVAGGPLRREVAVGEDGRFRLDRVPAGPRSLLARAGGRLPAARTGFRVEAGREEKGIALTLRPGAAVAGTILDPEGRPVADALLLALAAPLGREAGRARSGPGGRFRIEGLAAGAYEVRAILPGESFPDPLRPPVPATAPGEEIEVRLAASRSVEGVVVDPSGGPARGQVVVSHLERGATGVRLLETAREVERIPVGADGGFTTRPLPEGRWRIRAESPDGRVASADIEIAGDAPPRLQLLLAAGSTIRGRVVTGPVVKDLREVSVRLLLGGRADASVPAASVDAGGLFTLPGVPAGEHDLVVSLPGLAPAHLRNLVVSPDGGVVEVGDVLLGQGASLRVRVYGESRAPLDGAEVAVVDRAGLRREERANAAGLALFGGLAAGEHEVEVRAPAGVVLWRRVEVWADGEVEAILDLGEATSGIVTVRRGGGPVPGAVVTLHYLVRSGRTDTGSVQAVTDDRGRARLPDLSRGAGMVEVVPPGETPVLLPVSVESERIEIDLPTDGIEGEVVAASDGRPIPGAEVVARHSSGPWSGGKDPGVGTTADARGRFRYPSLFPGSWTVEAGARGFGSARLAGVQVLEGGGATRVRLLLEASAVLRGKVLDPAGRPVPGAMVEATDYATGEILPGGRVLSDSSGDFLLGGLAPGTFVATVRAGGLGASPPEVVALAAGETRVHDLQLLAGGTLEVRVVGLAGLPVDGAAVEVRDFFGRLVPLEDTASTDRDGILRVPGLRAGIYRVRAEKDGLTAEVRVRVDVRGGARAALALVPAR